MPQQNTFGDKLNIDKGGLFIQLKSKGEKVTFRLVAPPFYDGKHFIKNLEDKWEVTVCPKVMSEEYCATCDTYYKAVREAKAVEDKNEREKMLQEARKNKVKVTFYYPVIDRESETAKILKVPLLVRLKVDSEVELGTDILNTDFILMRTERPGNDYYVLKAVDSSKTKAFTPKETEELKKAKDWDIEEIVGMKVRESDEALVKEPKEEVIDEKKPHKEDDHKEDVDPDDIPF